MKPVPLLFLVCATVARLLGVTIGDTREEVVAELGEPSSRIVGGGHETLQYPGVGRVVLMEGTVTAIDRSDARPSAAPATQPAPPPSEVAQRASAPATTGNRREPPRRNLGADSSTAPHIVQMQRGDPVKLKHTNAWDAAADARRADLELRMEPIDFLPLDVIPGKLVLLVGLSYGVAYLLFAALTLPIAFKLLDVMAPPERALPVAALHAAVFAVAFSLMLYFSGAAIDKSPVRDYLFYSIAITVPTLVCAINRTSEVPDWSGAVRTALAASACIAGLLYGVSTLLPAAHIAAWIG